MMQSFWAVELTDALKLENKRILLRRPIPTAKICTLLAGFFRIFHSTLPRIGLSSGSSDSDLSSNNSGSSSDSNSNISNRNNSYDEQDSTKALKR